MMTYEGLDSIVFDKSVSSDDSGRMRRAWTYIDDIVSGILAAADRSLSYGVLNLGPAQPVVLADFARLIGQLADRKARPNPSPMTDASILYAYANISGACILLGYDQQVSVVESMTRFWHWYQQIVLGQE